MFRPIQVFCPYAYGLPHMHIWAAHTRTGSPYAYGIPVRVWAAHTRTGSPYTRMGQNSCFAHMRMECPYAYRYFGPYTSIATAMI